MIDTPWWQRGTLTDWEYPQLTKAQNTWETSSSALGPTTDQQGTPAVFSVFKKTINRRKTGGSASSNEQSSGSQEISLIDPPFSTVGMMAKFLHDNYDPYTFTPFEDPLIFSSGPITQEAHGVMDRILQENSYYSNFKSSMIIPTNTVLQVSNNKFFYFTHLFHEMESLGVFYYPANHQNLRVLMSTFLNGESHLVPNIPSSPFWLSLDLPSSLLSHPFSRYNLTELFRNGSSPTRSDILTHLFPNDLSEDQKRSLSSNLAMSFPELPNRPVGFSTNGNTSLHVTDKHAVDHKLVTGVLTTLSNMNSLLYQLGQHINEFRMAMLVNAPQVPQTSADIMQFNNVLTTPRERLAIPRVHDEDVPIVNNVVTTAAAVDNKPVFEPSDDRMESLIRYQHYMPTPVSNSAGGSYGGLPKFMMEDLFKRLLKLTDERKCSVIHCIILDYSGFPDFFSFYDYLHPEGDAYYLFAIYIEATDGEEYHQQVVVDMMREQEEQLRAYTEPLWTILFFDTTHEFSHYGYRHDGQLTPWVYHIPQKFVTSFHVGTFKYYPASGYVSLGYEIEFLIEPYLSTNFHVSQAIKDEIEFNKVLPIMVDYLPLDLLPVRNEDGLKRLRELPLHDLQSKVKNEQVAQLFGPLGKLRAIHAKTKKNYIRTLGPLISGKPDLTQLQRKLVKLSQNIEKPRKRMSDKEVKNLSPEENRNRIAYEKTLDEGERLWLILPETNLEPPTPQPSPPPTRPPSPPPPENLDSTKPEDLNQTGTVPIDVPGIAKKPLTMKQLNERAETNRLLAVHDQQINRLRRDLFDGDEKPSLSAVADKKRIEKELKLTRRKRDPQHLNPDGTLMMAPAVLRKHVGTMGAIPATIDLIQVQNIVNEANLTNTRALEHAVTKLTAEIVQLQEEKKESIADVKEIMATVQDSVHALQDKQRGLTEDTINNMAELTRDVMNNVQGLSREMRSQFDDLNANHESTMAIIEEQTRNLCVTMVDDLRVEMHDRVDAVQEVTMELTKNNYELRGQAMTLLEGQEAQTAQLTELNKQIQDQKQEMIRMVQNNEMTIEEINSVKAEFNNLEEQQQIVQKKMQDLSSKQNQGDTLLRDMQSRVTAAERETRNVGNQMWTLKNDVNSLARENEMNQYSITNVRQDINSSLQGVRQELNTAKNEYTLKFQTIDVEMNKGREEVEHLTQFGESLKTAVDASANRLQHLTTKTMDTEREMRDAVAQLRDENQSLTAEVAEKYAILDRVTQATNIKVEARAKEIESAIHEEMVSQEKGFLTVLSEKIATQGQIVFDQAMNSVKSMVNIVNSLGDGVLQSGSATDVTSADPPREITNADLPEAVIVEAPTYIPPTRPMFPIESRESTSALFPNIPTTSIFPRTQAATRESLFPLHPVETTSSMFPREMNAQQPSGRKVLVPGQMLRGEKLFDVPNPFGAVPFHATSWIPPIVYDPATEAKATAHRENRQKYDISDPRHWGSTTSSTKQELRSDTTAALQQFDAAILELEKLKPANYKQNPTRTPLNTMQKVELEALSKLSMELLRDTYNMVEVVYELQRMSMSTVDAVKIGHLTTLANTLAINLAARNRGALTKKQYQHDSVVARSRLLNSYR